MYITIICIYICISLGDFSFFVPRHFPTPTTSKASSVAGPWPLTSPAAASASLSGRPWRRMCCARRSWVQRKRGEGTHKNQGELEKLMLVLLVTVTRNGEVSHFSGEKVWVKWKRGFETAENGGSPMKAVG